MTFIDIGIIGYLIIFFLLTVILELIVALIFGYRKIIELLAIFFINLITNPAVNLILMFYLYVTYFEMNLLVLLSLELLVVYAEWKLLVYVLQKNYKKLLMLSSTMNFVSFLAGIFLYNSFK